MNPSLIPIRVHCSWCRSRAFFCPHCGAELLAHFGLDASRNPVRQVGRCQQCRAHLCLVPDGNENDNKTPCPTKELDLGALSVSGQLERAPLEPGGSLPAKKPPALQLPMPRLDQDPASPGKPREPRPLSITAATGRAEGRLSLRQWIEAKQPIAKRHGKKRIAAAFRRLYGENPFAINNTFTYTMIELERCDAWLRGARRIVEGQGQIHGRECF